MITEKKKTAMSMLRNSEKIYGLMSPCTQMPYVACDPEPYDDQVFLFEKEEDARKEAQCLANKKIPVRLAMIDKNSRLPFFVNLYSIGVNCLIVGKGTDSEVSLQIEELITRKIPEKIPEGKQMVENPELHLTALYIAQEMRRQPEQEINDDIKDMQEELMAHFKKGKYIIPVKGREKKEMPILKQKDGKIFHPVFTDIQEFVKFVSLHREEKFETLVVEAEKLPELLIKEAAGVAVNPMGVNLQLQLARRK